MQKTLVGIKEVDPFDIYDITVENDHCFELFNGIIAHNSMFPKDIVGGGTGSYYSSDNIWIVGRQQEKEGKDVLGYSFIINVEKSRYVKEKSRIPITVTFEGGIDTFSGIFDIALEGGFINEVSKGWYSTGDDKKLRRNEIESDQQYLTSLINNPKFNQYVKKKYQLSYGGEDE